MTGDPRWFVRMRGEEKDITTVWLTLGQRTMRYETYVMPAPEENAAELYEHLLRRNERLVGAHFAIGVEDAVFLRGELPDVALSEAELDRILGTLYATVERCFRSLLRIGFASRLAELTVPVRRAHRPQVRVRADRVGEVGSSTDPPGHCSRVTSRGLAWHDSSWWSWVAATWGPRC